MPVIPSGYANMTFVFSFDGDPEEMTFSVGAAMPDGAPSALELTEIALAWSSNWDLVLTNQAVFRRVDVVHNAAGTLTEHSVVVENRGNQTSSVLPSNCALLVQKRTGLVGRSKRGRFFVPGVCQELEVNAVGEISAAHLADLQTRATGFLEDLEQSANTGITDVVLLHSTAALGSPNAVSAFVVDDRIATQRRRLR